VVQNDSKSNLTDSGNGFVYTYDSKNRLLSAVSAGMGVNLAMAYDADNKVVSRTLNGTTRYFIYDGWSLIAEYNSTGDLMKSYAHGAGIDEILVQTQGSTDAFYHHDALGSTVLLTNASGNIVRSYEYDAFGQVSNPPSVDNLFSADPYANRFLYTGREFLKEANLYDYRNRVYSAELGRFLQTDPIRFDAGDGNLYRYVANDTINDNDPDGLQGGRYNKRTGGSANPRANKSSKANWLPPWDPKYGNWGGFGGGGDPVDDFDECFRMHDQCYDQCPDGRANISHCNCLKGRAKSRCTDEAYTKARIARTRCLKGCDQQLRDCLGKLKNRPSWFKNFQERLFIEGAESMPLWFFN
jgi:RHS repeat-associated protein